MRETPTLPQATDVVFPQTSLGHEDPPRRGLGFGEMRRVPHSYRSGRWDTFVVVYANPVSLAGMAKPHCRNVAKARRSNPAWDGHAPNE